MTVYVVKDILLKNSIFVLIYLSFYWKLVVCKVQKSFCCMIPLIIVCNFFDPYFILYLFVIVLLMFFSRKNFTMASNEQANDVYEMVFKDRLKARSFEHLNIWTYHFVRRRFLTQFFMFRMDFLWRLERPAVTLTVWLYPLSSILTGQVRHSI